MTEWREKYDAKAEELATVGQCEDRIGGTGLRCQLPRGHEGDHRAHSTTWTR